MCELTRKDRSIIPKKEDVLSQERKSFEDLVNDIDLSDNEKSVLKRQAALETATGEIFSWLKPAKLFLDFNEKVDQKMRNLKKEVLISQYISLSKENQEAINDLKNFIFNPFGNTLFNKILKILDNSPPDKALINYLANLLKNITQTKKFEEMFDKHKYILSQIEKLTPQALIVLSDFNNWPRFGVPGYGASGRKIISDWTDSFSKEYSEHKGIKETEKITHMKFVIDELKQIECVEANLLDEDAKNPSKNIKAVLTLLGKEIVAYINPNTGRLG